MWPDRAGGIPSYAPRASSRWSARRAAKHIGGLSGWSYWLGWFPVAPINMILTAAYLSSLFSLPQGGSIHLFGTYGAPISHHVLLISFIGLLAIYVPCYFGVKLGAGFATVLGILSMVPLTVLVLLPLFKTGCFHWSQHRRLPYAQAGVHAELHVHHRLDVPDHLERDRDGGRRLLCRRVPQRPARRQDRADRRGHLRHAHLHPDPAGLRRRARRGPVHQRPAHPLHRLHQRAVRPRLVDQVVHRPAADPRAAAARC